MNEDLVSEDCMLQKCVLFEARDGALSRWCDFERFERVKKCVVPTKIERIYFFTFFPLLLHVLQRLANFIVDVYIRVPVGSHVRNLEFLAGDHFVE